MSAVISTIDVSEFDGDGLDIIGTDGFNALFGTSQGELIDAKDGDDVAFGRGGNDLIIGGDGNDLIGAGKGSDSVLGGDGDDIIIGDSMGDTGHDVIQGGDGNDLIFGSGGDDSLFGGDGDDTLFGGSGMDVLEDSAGSDLMLGGEGEDVFFFNAANFSDDSMDIVADFVSGEDRIDIKGLGADDEFSFDGTTFTVNGNDVISFNAGDIFGSNEPTIEESEDGGFEVV